MSFGIGVLVGVAAVVGLIVFIVVALQRGWISLG